MHTLLCSHDTDPRYAEATVKARVAELYLPLLSLARDTLPRLHDFAGQQAREGWVTWSRVRSPKARVGKARALGSEQGREASSTAGSVEPAASPALDSPGKWGQ